jgi:hypothetical protein
LSTIPLDFVPTIVCRAIAASCRAYRHMQPVVREPPVRNGVTIPAAGDH